MSEVLGGVDLKDSLTKKIGGLPGAAWVGIALGGYYLYKKRVGSLGTSSAASGSAATADSSGNVVSAGKSSTWASTAADHLSATTDNSISDIQKALDNYQNNLGLNPIQQAIVDQAIVAHGAPDTSTLPWYQQPVTDGSLWNVLPYTMPQQPIGTQGGVDQLPSILPQTSTYTTPRSLPTNSNPNNGTTRADSGGNLYLQPGIGAPSISLPPYVAPAEAPVRVSPNLSRVY